MINVNNAGRSHALDGHSLMAKYGDMTPIIKRQTLHQRVYENLKERILSGQIEPGTKINETEIAQIMNTSTTPVREAFRMLASEGLLKIEPWKGVVVHAHAAHEVLDIYQCRMALESYALTLTMERFLSGSRPETLSMMVDEAIIRTKMEDTSLLAKWSRSPAHRLWVYNCGNKRLIQLLESLNEMVITNDKNNDNRTYVDVQEEHIAILEAMKRQDVKTAQQLLLEHLRTGYNFYMQMMEGLEE